MQKITGDRGMSELHEAVRKTLPAALPLFRELQFAKAAIDEPVIVAALGLLKAGKSTLLNMLAANAGEEPFRTGPIRATTACQKVERDGFVFLDTPGLDAGDDDEDEAWNGVKSADFILFCHSLEGGELDQKEIDLLRKLQALPGNQRNIESRLLIVFTRLAEVEQDAEVIVQKVEAQIRRELAFKEGLKTLRVASHRYRKGRLEAKQSLVDASGIPALKAYLGENRALLQKKANEFRASRVKKITADLRAAVQAETRRVREKRSVAKQELESLQRFLTKSVAAFIRRTAESLHNAPY